MPKPRRERNQALSTGQAARFCFVTPETVLNWIHAGRLKAQRTAGGQFRVLVEDLRAFMALAGMETRLLEAEKDIRPYCWEFHCQISARYGSPSLEMCDDCLAHRSGTLNCWELHGLLPVTRRRFHECATCDYHQRFAHQRGEED